jgi:hypothetical protein
MPSPPVLKSAPAAEKNSPARETRVNESEPSGPDLAAPGQPVKKPGLQMPWSNILNTPDGPATRTGPKDPAAAEVPPSPSSSSVITPAEVPLTAVPAKAAAVGADASALPTTASPGLPAVSPASAIATTPPQVLPKTVSGALPLQRPAFGPDGKPLPRQTVKTDAAPPHRKAPPDKPAPAKPPLPWEAPPPAQPLPHAAAPQK